MLDRWASFGFTHLVSTPHLFGPLEADYAAKIAEAGLRMRAEAAGRGIDLQTGFEIMLYPGLPADLEKGAPLTLAGSNAVLVEVPFSQWPSFTDSTLFAIQTAGFQPVLAHPERYDAVLADVTRALTLGERGVVLQVSFGSLAGTLGRSVQRVAAKILSTDLPVVLASDAHGAGQRLLAIPDGIARATEIVGGARVAQLTVENPRALLQSVGLPEPASIAPEHGDGRTFRRLKGLLGPARSG